MAKKKKVRSYKRKGRCPPKRVRAKHTKFGNCRCRYGCKRVIWGGNKGMQTHRRRFHSR